jgi:FixJ family two-component response regulator
MAALVYVVDDEKLIATTLAAILTRSGFEAIPFLDPLDALLSAESRCPDVLITDVMMPQLNGVDLGIQFKAIHPQCRVLLFSGHAATSDLMKDAKRDGHNFDLLTKPVHPIDLISVIREMTA